MSLRRSPTGSISRRAGRWRGRGGRGGRADGAVQSCPFSPARVGTAVAISVAISAACRHQRCLSPSALAWARVSSPLSTEAAVTPSGCMHGCSSIHHRPEATMAVYALCFHAALPQRRTFTALCLSNGVMATHHNEATASRGGMWALGCAGQGAEGVESSAEGAPSARRHR